MDLKYEFILPFEEKVLCNQVFPWRNLSVDKRVSTFSVCSPFTLHLNNLSDDDKQHIGKRDSKDSVSSCKNLIFINSENISPTNSRNKEELRDNDPLLVSSGSTKFINPSLILDVSQDKIHDNNVEISKQSSFRKNRSSSFLKKKPEDEKSGIFLNVIREETESHHYGSENSRVRTEMHMDILENDDHSKVSKDQSYENRKKVFYSEESSKDNKIEENSKLNI